MLQLQAVRQGPDAASTQSFKENYGATLHNQAVQVLSSLSFKYNYSRCGRRDNVSAIIFNAPD